MHRSLKKHLLDVQRQQECPGSCQGETRGPFLLLQVALLHKLPDKWYRVRSSVQPQSSPLKETGGGDR
jgi:hypothetical protein